jgi:hypothetical protein
MKLNWRKNGLVIDMEGICNFETLMEVHDKILGDTRFDSIIYQVWNYKNSELIAFDHKDVHVFCYLGKFASIWTKKQTVAFLVNESPFHFESLRIIKKVLEPVGWTIQLFYEKEPLIKWIFSETGETVIL